MISIVMLFSVSLLILFNCEPIKKEQEILVKAYPANIHDLLKKSEDYIDFKYSISSIRADNIEIGDESFVAGNDVYVCVEAGEDGYAVVTTISLNPIKKKICLKGMLTSIVNNSFNVDYNTGKYYIPEDIDFSEDIKVRLLVDNLGNVEIKTFLSGDKEI